MKKICLFLFIISMVSLNLAFSLFGFGRRSQPKKTTEAFKPYKSITKTEKQNVTSTLDYLVVYSIAKKNQLLEVSSNEEREGRLITYKLVVRTEPLQDLFRPRNWIEIGFLDKEGFILASTKVQYQDQVEEYYGTTWVQDPFAGHIVAADVKPLRVSDIPSGGELPGNVRVVEREIPEPEPAFRKISDEPEPEEDPEPEPEPEDFEPEESAESQTEPEPTEEPVDAFERGGISNEEVQERLQAFADSEPETEIEASPSDIPEVQEAEESREPTEVIPSPGEIPEVKAIWSDPEEKKLEIELAS